MLVFTYLENIFIKNKKKPQTKQKSKKQTKNPTALTTTTNSGK